MKRVFFLLAMLAAGVTALAQDAEVKKAIRYMEIEQPTKAFETINQAIKTYPEATKLYYYLGYLHLKKGDNGQALKAFEKGIAANPEVAINHVGLGAIRMAEGKTAEAKTFFDKAQTMTKSKDASVLQAIAEAHLVDVKYAETALKLLEKAKSLDGNSYKTFMLMGEADLLQNKGGPSISNCERAARIEPTSAKPWYNIALVYQRSQNFTFAEENFQKAVSVDPEFTLAYKELGELYYSMKDGAKAAKAYESFLKLKENPNDQDKTRYAFFLFMAKDYAKANEIFKPLAAKTDASATTIKYYGYSLVTAGDLPEAQKAFDRYFSMVPVEKIEFSDYNYFADLLLKLKKDSLFIVNSLKSLALNSDQPEVLQTVAETQFKNKRFVEAAGSYETLIKLRKKPMSLDYYSLGRAYYYNNQFPKADTAFQKLVEMQPTRTIGYQWLGRTKANLDPDAKEDAAKIAYEKLVEIASPAPDAGTNRKDLIEAYEYIGFYYSQRDNLNQAKAYFEKVLALDPTNAKALEVIKLLKEGQKAQKQQRNK